MSSSNIAYRTAPGGTYSNKHSNIAGHSKTKSGTDSKTSNHEHVNADEKQNTSEHCKVYGIKDSKEHVPTKTHMKNAHAAVDEHTYETRKYRTTTGTHGHSTKRGMVRKSNVHKQEMDKRDTVEQGKTNHPDIDHAVFISISTDLEDIPPGNAETVNQNQP